MNGLNIINNNGKLLLDSRDVAETTGKRHDHLIRDIEGYVSVLNQNPNLGADQFFLESSYEAGTGKKYKCYLLTKKGCDMVANKMTGEKGVIFTATYVTQFEKMEEKLKSLSVPSYMIENPIERAERWIKEQKEKQALETKSLMLEQQVKENEPKVTYYDEILSSKGAVPISNFAKDYGLSAVRLNKILNEQKVQYKINGQWLLYSKYQDKGYTKSSTYPITRSDGTPDVSIKTKWTQKGRLFIHELLSNLDIKPLIDMEETN